MIVNINRHSIRIGIDFIEFTKCITASTTFRSRAQGGKIDFIISKPTLGVNTFIVSVRLVFFEGFPVGASFSIDFGTIMFRLSYLDSQVHNKQHFILLKNKNLLKSAYTLICVLRILKSNSFHFINTLDACDENNTVYLHLIIWICIQLPDFSNSRTSWS